MRGDSAFSPGIRCVRRRISRCLWSVSRCCIGGDISTSGSTGTDARWRSLSPERFDAIQYIGMAMYQIAIVLFNLVPYLALRLVG